MSARKGDRAWHWDDASLRGLRFPGGLRRPGLAREASLTGFVSLALLASVASVASAASADVVRDGSVGTAGPGLVATDVEPGGGIDFLISEADGRRSGNNLFHNFESFHLTSSERAIYQGPASIQNLITRVSGGASSIDGVVRSEIPSANLFFINPVGAVFGENALGDAGSLEFDVSDQIRLRASSILTDIDNAAGGNVTLRGAPGSAFVLSNSEVTARAVYRFEGSSAEARLRADTPLSDRKLLPLEQFALGGAGSVRGLRRNQLVRDQGFAADWASTYPFGVPRMAVRSLR